MPKTNTHVGQVNLRGKKSKALSCGCCDVFDFREEYNIRRMEREEMRHVDDDTIYPEDLAEWSDDDAEDRGIWTVHESSDGTVALQSSDFKFDVAVTITGDFGFQEVKVEYARLLAKRLNGSIPE